MSKNEKKNCQMNPPKLTKIPIKKADAKADINHPKAFPIKKKTN